jgi:hypothetical protein
LLLNAHSGFRYLVFLIGVITLGYALYGVVTGRPMDVRMRRLGAAFAGTFHVQILLGLGVLFSGRFGPQLIGHIFMMLFAAACAQIVPSVMRRRQPEKRTYLPYLVGTLVAIALAAGGVMALGRPVLG